MALASVARTPQATHWSQGCCPIGMQCRIWSPCCHAHLALFTLATSRFPIFSPRFFVCSSLLVVIPCASLAYRSSIFLSAHFLELSLRHYIDFGQIFCSHKFLQLAWHGVGIHWLHNHDGLTHWGWDKMAAILQWTFTKSFSWMKMCEFQQKFDWNLFAMVQWISQHCFRSWLGIEYGTSHDLSQRLFSFLMHICITPSDSEAETKWQPFCGRDFFKSFSLWKCLNFDTNSC